MNPNPQGLTPFFCPNVLFIDADADGMDDAWESTGELNPVANDRDADLDGDGLTNLQEYFRGTRPDMADTDGDGYSDAAEVAAGTNPLVSFLTDPAPIAVILTEPIGTTLLP